MKLYWQILRLLWAKLILRRSSGRVIKDFAMKMGITYIKLAQILAMHNFGKLFTEQDRKDLSSICDNCNPISFKEIQEVLEREYGGRLTEIFEKIEQQPLGSSSVSQVHKAWLKSGEVVVIKVKRADVTHRVEKDIAQIRKIMRRFAWLVKFKNFTAGNRSLDLYSEWILQEVDFKHECENIRQYRQFVERMNTKTRQGVNLHVPALYEEYCTDNIIVMQYISALTISQLSLTPSNKTKVVQGINSFIGLSFQALLGDEEVIFHGDPHGGNICIEENGEVWFIDLGLLCIMDSEDAKLCREFFLAAYLGNAEKLYQLLVAYGNMSENDRHKFREDYERYCREVKQKEVSYYFVDMLNICLYYDFELPDFLFGMAKAFLCLNGIGNIVGNNVIAAEFLHDQVTRYLLRRSLADCGRVVRSIGGVMIDGVRNIPGGIVRTLSSALSHNCAVKKDMQALYHNFVELVEMINFSSQSER